MSTVKGNCASAAYWWLTRGATCGTVICISCFQPPTCDWHMWIKLMTNMSAEGKITPVLGCCENAATEETQYAAHVNKFLIALAAVQTSEIVAKKEKKKKRQQKIQFQWSERSLFISSLLSLGRGSVSVVRPLHWMWFSGGCLRRREALSGSSFEMWAHSQINCFFYWHLPNLRQTIRRPGHLCGTFDLFGKKLQRLWIFRWAVLWFWFIFWSIVQHSHHRREFHIYVPGLLSI